MKQLKIFLILILLFTIGLNAKDYTKNRVAKEFINMMVKEHHFKRSYLNTLFKNIKFQKRALSIFNPKYRKKVKKTINKYPKKGSWDIYEKVHLTDSKVKKGIEYLRSNRATFKKVYKKYGVPPEYITAIIGVESHYGYNRGKFPALDTLATLGFEENRRSKYFRYELKKLLLLSKSQGFNPKDVKSSYAGAIGLGQFMPSSYHYAVDFNGDGKKSMQTTSDAIAGIANYFKKNGWRKGEPVATRVSFTGNRFTAKKTGYNHKYSRNSLKGISPKFDEWKYNGKVRLIKLKRYYYDELWYGAENFYVITRYNHSSYYAMVIHQLAKRIRGGYWKKYGRF
ncbi:Membrane-bound lytic murein transglycosylase B precursor [hydrothermal vent metagenome]|uniref:Membrane-bound lytic murein transglycosylase B n=1 Tax=hydrothermal vent metagenome TaxID=652676 RepID=A0A1W1BIE8_9ZZZZ